MGKQNKYNDMKKRNSFRTFFILVFLIVFSISGFSQHGWTVVKYTNSTTAYATVTIDGQAAEPGDFLGAFVGGECRAFEAIVIDSGTAYSTLVINGETIETVAFKVWDNSTQTVLDAEYSTQTNPGNTIGYPPNFLPIAVNYPGESITDPRDGKVYKIVEIGDQWWMAENLAFLPAVSPSSIGSDTEIYYYVYGYDGSNVSEAKATNNYVTYGVLYNWEAAKISCPEGWYLPSDDEWKILEKHLGMSDGETNNTGWRNSGDVGNKLKSTSGWYNNGNGDNSSGFKALPGGARSFYGGFDDIDESSNFWASSPSGPSGAWKRHQNYDYNGVNRGDSGSRIGFSVRCIKSDPNVGLVAHYPLNGDANDISGNGNHGQINGPQPAHDRFNFENKCYNFDGNNDFIKVPYNTSLDINDNTLSISAFVKLQAYRNDGAILTKGVNQGVYSLKQSGTAQTNGTFNLDLNSQYSTWQLIRSNSPIPLDLWTHLVAVVDGTNVKLYINGILDNTENLSINLINNTEDMYIGVDMPASDEYWNGSIDDIRIYNDPLTNSEILDLYHEGGWDPLLADFTADPLSGDYPLFIKFTDQSTGNPTSWSWDFNEDDVEDSNEQNPEWCFVAPGDYSVKLSVNDDINSDEETKPDYIHVNGWTGNTLTDQRDSKVYKTIQLGDQEWMAENLNYESAIGSWHYENNLINGNIYGRLYDWNTAVDDGHVNGEDICPEGWHMPSDDEWKQLELFLGMTQADVDGVDWRLTGDVGNKIKSATGWLNNGNGNNSSIFTGLPGGLRQANGSFIYQKEGGYFWSSSEHSTGHIWGRGLRSSDNGVDRQNDYFPDQAYSVRCIKNVAPGGLIAHYSLDGHGDDISGNENHGIINGAVPANNQFGENGKALDFDGIDDEVDLDPLDNFSEPDFTIMTWFNIENIQPGDQSTDVIINTPSGHISIFPHNNTDVSNIVLQALSYDNRTGTGSLNLIQHENVTMNQWHFIVLRANGNQTSIFFDGHFFDNVVPFATNNNYPYAKIGNTGYTGGVPGNFNGIIDEVKIYNIALSNDQIIDYYNEFLPRFIDPRDGQEYRYVEIGDQTWMAENLNYETASGSWIYDDNPVLGDIYGRLYDWNTAVADDHGNNQDICPDGWHLPSDNEWQELEKFIGMSESDAILTGWRGSNQGGILKMTGTEYWNAPNTSATNDYLFSALGGGARNNTGNPADHITSHLKEKAFFWTATESDANSAYERRFAYDEGRIFRESGNPKINGMSVRCVKGIPGDGLITDFGADPTSGDYPLIVKFTDMSTGHPTSWSWDFNGDGVEDSDEQNPEWCFIHPGDYSVKLTIGNGTNSDEKLKPDYIHVNEWTGPTMTDQRDGKAYKTVQIGDQTWMAENLAYLPEVNPRSVGSFYDPYYYVYGYEGTDVTAAKATDNYAIYGVLYNCKAATIECPSGWHLPSDEEWKTMEEYLGMDSSEADELLWRNSGDVGKKLKSNSSLWINEGHGDNSSGFNALPSGYRHNEGSIGHIGDLVKFWSPIPGWSQLACGRNVSFNNDGVYRETRHHSSHGFSVRCVKNVESVEPVVSTIQTSDITNNSAQSGGNVTDEGSSPVTTRGVCWSTNSNPTIADNITTDGSGTGSYTSSITGLSANTTYYVRAYATNNVGTGYGAEESFTTSTSSSDISLTLLSGTLNGNSISPSSPELTVDANESITGSLIFDADNHYGNPGGIMPFAWTPGWGDHETSYTQISGWVPHNTVTNYNVSINQTAPSTPGTYYLWFIMSDKYNSGEMICCDRPAVWDDGDDIADMGETQYSQVVSTGEVDWTYNNSPRHEKAVRAVKIVVQSQLTFTDSRDSQTYEYLTIGTQTWMAENLNYETASGSWWYDDNPANGEIFGRLYDWNTSTADNHGNAVDVCPIGWHMPSDSEWQVLINYLGGNAIAGGKMKTTGTIEGGDGLWQSPNTGATNESGFSAVPGGARDYTDFYLGNRSAYFWSSTSAGSSGGRYLVLDDNSEDVYHTWYYREYGFSIRCIKNITNNDATLSDLKVEDQTITGFDPSTLSYNYDLTCGVTVVPTVTVTTNDQNATFVINNASSLPGTTSIIVTAADGTTIQTYSINFVFAEKINRPDWTTPVGVQYSMTVHGQVTVFGRGLVISDCSLIAGFADGVCLGVASIYQGPAGMQFQLALGTNNDQTFPVSFKVYDYASDEVLTISEKHNFVNNSVINTIINPFMFHAGMVELIIPLVHGWNWLSVNTLPEVPSLANVLENYPALDNDEIKTAPALGGAATYYGGVWYGLTTALPEFGIEPGINPGVMYLLNSQTTNPGNLSIMGYPVDVSVPIPIVENWNWLGYKPQTALDLATSLASLDSEDNDEIKTAPALGGAATYYGGVWYGLTTAIPEYGIEPGLNPGVGYLFNSSKVDELIYPSGSVSPPIIVNNDLDNQKPGISEIWTNPTGKLYTMVIHAKVLLPDGGFLEAPGSKLAAFKDDQCRGVFEIFDGPTGKQFQLSVASDLENEADMIYLAYDAIENKIYEIAENLNFIYNTTLGKIQDPVYLSVNAIMGIDEYLNRAKSIEFNTYPNPFKNTLNISFTNPVHQKVLVALYGIKGQLIKVIEDRPCKPGNHLIDWNSNDMPNGMYYIRVETKGFVRNQKVVKMN